MWPFKSAQIRKHAAAALASGASNAATVEALAALMTLPQTPESLACYRAIALDRQRAWSLRDKAATALALHPNTEGARALLQCVASDLRQSGLEQLLTPGMPEALRQTGSEATAILSAALRRITDEGEQSFSPSLAGEIASLWQVLKAVGTPECQALLPAAGAAMDRLRNLQVSYLLRQALTSKRHDDVRHAVAALEDLRSPEARAALDEFARTTRQRYEAEFAQRHAAPKPPPAPPAPADDEAQRYAAGSSRGIEPELLALVSAQLNLLKSLHAHGSLAPLAAALDTRGEIQGFNLIIDKPDARVPGVEETIAVFQIRFREQARAGAIVACGVFFHGCHGPGRGALRVAPALQADDADCLVALLEHRDGQAVACVIQYEPRRGGTWHYEPAYYVPSARNVFVNAEGVALAPNQAKHARFPRRPMAAGGQGLHPEMLTLLGANREMVTSLRASGSFAPVAAWMKSSGEIQAGILLAPDALTKLGGALGPADPIVMFPPNGRETTPANAVAYYVDWLRAAAERGEIVASAIFYHACFDAQMAPLGLMPGLAGEEPDCLVVELDHRLSQSKSVVLRYTLSSDRSCEYDMPQVFSSYPLVFNESGGPYAEHVAMKLAEALRALVAPDAPTAPDWWHRRLRPLLPETPLVAAQLDPILEPMGMPDKIAVLRQLADLGRTEVGPIATALLASANAVEQQLLVRLIAKCGPASP